jgi:RNA polymerase sigma factor (sigma-70 family)
MQKRTSVDTSEIKPKINDDELKDLLIAVDRHLRYKYRTMPDLDDLVSFVGHQVNLAVTLEFDPEHPRANLRPWLFERVKWAVSRYFRKRKIPTQSLSDVNAEASPEEIADFFSHLQVDGSEAETKAMVWRHVNALPDRTRAIFVAYYVGDYTAEELGVIYGCTARHIRYMMATTRKLLKERMSGEKKVVKVDGKYRTTY